MRKIFALAITIILFGFAFGTNVRAPMALQTALAKEVYPQEEKQQPPKYQKPAKQNGSSHYQKPPAYSKPPQQKPPPKYQKPAKQNGPSHYQKPPAYNKPPQQEQPAKPAPPPKYQKPAKQNGASHYQKPPAYNKPVQQKPAKQPSSYNKQHQQEGPMYYQKPHKYTKQPKQDGSHYQRPAATEYKRHHDWAHPDYERLNWHKRHHKPRRYVSPFRWYDPWDYWDNHYRTSSYCFFGMIYDDDWLWRFPGCYSYRWYDYELNSHGFYYHGKRITKLILIFDRFDGLVGIGFMYKGIFVLIRDDLEEYYFDDEPTLHIIARIFD